MREQKHMTGISEQGVACRNPTVNRTCERNSPVAQLGLPVGTGAGPCPGLAVSVHTRAEYLMYKGWRMEIHTHPLPQKEGEMKLFEPVFTAVDVVGLCVSPCRLSC